MIRIFAILLILLAGCGEDRNGLSRDPRLANLTDEATPQERDDIMSTLSKIESFTKEVGAARSFRSLPIVVTTRSDLSETDYVGLCEQDSSGRGVKIILKREVIDQSREPVEGISTALFTTLLHEIGHCYFRREHECKYLEKKGFDLQFKWKTLAGHERLFRFGALPKSVMRGICERDTSLPEGLEKYYVGEIIGKHRAETLDQLKAFSEFEIVPESLP